MDLLWILGPGRHVPLPRSSVARLVIATKGPTQEAEYSASQKDVQ